MTRRKTRKNEGILRVSLFCSNARYRERRIDGQIVKEGGCPYAAFAHTTATEGTPEYYDATNWEVNWYQM